MPRVGRKKETEEVYELTQEEMALEQRLYNMERNLITKMEAALLNPRLNAKDMGLIANACSKIRSESRQKIKLYGRLDLSRKSASSDPEAAKNTAIAYLCSLPLLDRVAILAEAYPEDTVVAYLCGVGPIATRKVVQRVKDTMDLNAVRAQDVAAMQTAAPADPPAPEPQPTEVVEAHV